VELATATCTMPSAWLDEPFGAFMAAVEIMNRRQEGDD
jgi:hypothetical protein